MLCLTRKGEVDLIISVHDVVNEMNVDEDLVILDFGICLGLRVQSAKLSISSFLSACPLSCPQEIYQSSVTYFKD